MNHAATITADRPEMIADMAIKERVEAIKASWSTDERERRARVAEDRMQQLLRLLGFETRRQAG